MGLTLDGGREIVWGSTYFNPTAFVHSTTGNSTLNLANGFDLAGSTRTVLVGDATINTANGASQLGGNIRTSSGTAGLTKTGTGTLLLSGTNTYNGATTISSGILRFSNQVSLYNNTPASWTAANIVVANTGTLALNVGGAGQFTTGNVTTLLTNLGGANGTSTTGFAAGSSIGFDTTNASGGTFTVADNIADSSGAGGGAMGVVKLGSGTLVLSGASNSYSGATVIRGGTLSLTGSLTGNTAISTADNNNGGGSTVLNGILNQSAAGVISGATASFTQGSSGTSILSGDNSYGGGTTLNAGTLTVGHANALGTGTGTIALNGGTIQSDSATARSFTNAVTIGGNFTVGGTGNLTFSNTGASALAATRQITVTTSGVIATFAQAFSGAGGITKAGAGTLKLTGTNSIGPVTVNAGLLTIDGGTTSTGTFALPNASVSIVNGGTLSTSSGSAAAAFSSGSSMTVTGGNGVTSTWNLNGGAIGTTNASSNAGTFLIDGAGYAGSARVTNVGALTWGRSLSNATLTLTNGGQMNVSGEIRTGVTYYNTTGNSDIIIGGGTATSTFTGNNQTFTIGYAERNASKDNDVIVNSGGVLTGIGNMFVGHVLYGVALGTSTNNKLKVDGTGTASMTSVTVGYGQINVDAANANLLEVTNGGTLTTSGTNYIGRATVAGAVSNANTATVTGTGSTWNAGASQNVFVGFTANATATSNNNIFTVGSGGSVTGINSLTLGSGTGTETGNELVMLGEGSLTATTISVSAGNTLRFGNGGTTSSLSLTGNITNDGSMVFNLSDTITQGTHFDSAFGGSGSVTQAGSGILVLTGANSYTGATTVSAGTLLIGAAAPSGSAGALGNATSNVGLGGVSSASILTNGAFTVARNIDVAAGAGTTIIGGNTANTSSFTGNITLSKAATLQAFTGGTVDFTTGTWTTNNFGLTIGTSGNTGTVKISNAIATSGGINLNFGTLELNSAFTSGNMTIASGTTLSGTGSVAGTTGVTSATVNGTSLVLTDTTTFNSTGNILSGTVTSTNGMALASSAELTLNGALTGALAIGNGILTGTGGSVSGAATLNGGAINLTSGTLGSTLAVTGGAWNGAGAVTGAVTSSSGTFTIGSGANLTANGGLTVSGDSTIAAVDGTSMITGSVNYTSSSNSTFAGEIAGSGKTLTMNSSGTKLTLTGANSYTGATTVTDGTLAVNGSLANTSTTVQTGATLQGSGSIGGSVTIQGGGTLATGNSIQSLATGALSLEALATFAYEIDKSVALASAGDLTGVTGTLTIAATATLTLTELNTLASGTWDNNEKLTLISYSGVWNGGLFDYAGANGGLGGALTDDSTFTFNGVQWQFNYNDTAAGSNYIGDLTTPNYVTMTVVPEPRAALLGGIGMLLLLRRRRN